MVFTSVYCGQPVFSTIPIPELPQSVRSGDGINFYLNTTSEQIPELKWTHYWTTPMGKKVIGHCRVDNIHWLHFPSLADFRILLDDNEIACFPYPKIPEATIRHLLLDQVLPRYLAQQGRLMLHASAVWLNPGALLFIGSSGAGKSTLAGNFHQAGNPALADDCVALNENRIHPLAVPSYGGLRLWDDSLKILINGKLTTEDMAHYSSKKRVLIPYDSHQETGKGFPVEAVIVISPAADEISTDLSLEPLSQREAYMELVKQSFLLDVNDLDSITVHLQSLGRIMPALKVFRLSMPRDYDLLTSVRKIILEKIKPESV